MTAAPSDSPSADDTRTSDRLVGIAAMIGLLAAVIAGTTVWLLLTDPVGMAGVIEESDLAPLLWEVAATILSLLARLFEYF